MGAMRFRWFALFCLSASIPACTSLATSGTSPADVAETLERLSPGARCRVALRAVSEHQGGESQLTYEGTVLDVSDSKLTLESASLEAISRTPPALKTDIPLLDRQVSEVTVVTQSLEEPVVIPIEKIDRVSPTGDTHSAREVKR
jgi:hypothetical protein